MSKKTKITKPQQLPDNHEERLDDDIVEPLDDQEDNGPFVEEYEPEIDPDDSENDDEYYISKAKTNSCIKNNYCNRCDGSPHEPEGLCHCVCHDIA